MFNLAGRHIKIYFRDPWAVFFSLLSVFILLGLFVLFLNMNINSALPAQLQGTSEGEYLVYSWILSGVLLISMVTVPLGVLGMMVEDKESKAIYDFYVSPIDRTQVVLSYLLAALVVALLIGSLNLFAGIGILWWVSGYTLPMFDLVTIFGLMILTAFLFSGLFYYVVSFVKTNAAHGALSTLTGTLIGFFAGIYVPVGIFGRGLQTTLGSLPFMQGAALIRDVYMRDAIEVVFGSNQEAADRFRQVFGLEIVWNDQALESWILLAVLGAWTILFVSLSIFRIKNVKL